MLLLLKISGVFMMINGGFRTYLALTNLFENMDLVFGRNASFIAILFTIIMLAFCLFHIYTGYKGAVCQDYDEDIELCEKLGKILVVIYVFVNIITIFIGEFSLYSLFYTLLIPTLYFVAARLNLNQDIDE